MIIPNADRAVVDLEKLTEYCLNPEHPRGKHKARVFRAACGFTAENAESIREQLLDAVANAEAQGAPPNVHGERYVIECL
jgi:hypothetical protein